MPSFSPENYAKLSDSGISLSFDVSGKIEDAKRLQNVVAQIDLQLPKGRYHISKDKTVLHIHPVEKKLKNFKAGDELGDADLSEITGAATFEFKAYGFSKIVLHLEALEKDPVKENPSKNISADLVPIAHLLPELNRIQKIPAADRSVTDLKTLGELAEEVQRIFKQVKLDKESEKERQNRLAKEAAEIQKQKEAEAAKERQKKASAKSSTSQSSSSGSGWSSQPSWKGSG